MLSGSRRQKVFVACDTKGLNSLKQNYVFNNMYPVKMTLRCNNMFGIFFVEGRVVQVVQCGQKSAGSTAA